MRFVHSIAASRTRFSLRESDVRLAHRNFTLCNWRSLQELDLHFTKLMPLHKSIIASCMRFLLRKLDRGFTSSIVASYIRWSFCKLIASWIRSVISELNRRFVYSVFASRTRSWILDSIFASWTHSSLREINSDFASSIAASRN